jgi:hypothetical protein
MFISFAWLFLFPFFNELDRRPILQKKKIKEKHLKKGAKSMKQRPFFPVFLSRIVIEID